MSTLGLSYSPDPSLALVYSPPSTEGLILFSGHSPSFGCEIKSVSGLGTQDYYMTGTLPCPIDVPQ